MIILQLNWQPRALPKKISNSLSKTTVLLSQQEKINFEGGKKDNYTRKEFSYNSFERSLQLPETLRQEVHNYYKLGLID